MQLLGYAVMLSSYHSGVCVTSIMEGNGDAREMTQHDSRWIGVGVNSLILPSLTECTNSVNSDFLQ